MNGEKPREVPDEINKERGSREKAPNEISFGKEPTEKTPDEFKPRKKRTTDLASEGVLESEQKSGAKEEEIERLKIIECRDFIESNKEEVSTALNRLIKNHCFLLIGEAHLSEVEPIRQEIAKSLSELKDNGLTHVALEADWNKQTEVDSLDYEDPNIKSMLEKLKIGGVGWYDGNFDVLIEAKRLGLKVLLINYMPENTPREKFESADFQNQRDEIMFSIIKSETNDSSKVLIFIGDDHVHKKPVQKIQSEYIQRLGCRLSKEYKSEQVVSIRFVSQSGRFDNLLSFMSKTPTPTSLHKKTESIPVILPDSGPLKGDDRVTASDYIITII